MASAETIVAETPEKAIEELFRLAAIPEAEIASIRLGPWVSPHVYLPGPEHSIITPPFMEAFLAAQKQFLQLAALAKSGVADSRQLSDSERLALELQVKVTDGSSNLHPDYQKALENGLITMLKKLTGKQATIVILGLAILGAGTYGWSAYLEQEKTVRIAELTSREHVASLQAMNFATQEHMNTIRKVMDVLHKQGEIGQRALHVAQTTNDALLRAASRTATSTTINDQTLTPEEAERLRASPRKQATTRYSKVQVRVVDINTADEADIQMILMDVATKDQHRMKLPETLFAPSEKVALFSALETRDQVWVELMFREIDGEARSVEFLRVVPDPAVAKQ